MLRICSWNQTRAGSTSPRSSGETLRLADFKPGVELFHFTEIRGYYSAVAQVHLKAGRLEVAVAIHRILAELLDPRDPGLQALQMGILRENFGRMQQRLAAEKAREIRVRGLPLPDPPADASPPEFHHAEISQLYGYGIDLPPAAFDALLALPRETCVADLVSVLKDGIARVRLFLDGGDVGDAGFFPLHAISLLGEMRAVESLPAVLEFLSQHEDALDFWLGDYLEVMLWEPLYFLIKDQLELAREFVCSPGLSEVGRGAVSRAVADLARLEPERRPEVLDWFRGVLEFLLVSPADDGILDTGFVTGLVWQLMDLRGSEAMPLIAAHFDRGHVAESFVGNLDRAASAMSDPSRNLAERKKLQGMRAHYKGLKPQLASPPELPRGLARLALPAGAGDSSSGHRSAVEARVGRNDPCPCGSGKKYKKCCLR